MRGTVFLGWIAVAGAHQPRPPRLTGWQELRSPQLLADLGEALPQVRLAELEPDPEARLALAEIHRSRAPGEP
jgi:hypothetical protein